MYNAGDQDLLIGSPADRPELFVWSSGHNHYHLVDFIEYQLYDIRYQKMKESYKQAICFFDSQRISNEARGTRQFSPGSCNTEQGLSAGWADLYRANITCQFIAIDEIPDGSYSLVATVNAQGVVEESSHLDNTICKSLRIEGDRVIETTGRFCTDWDILHTEPGQRTPEARDLCLSDSHLICWE
jgi:hypothetical protein